MMKPGDQPAWPVARRDGNGQARIYEGMTKRESFAMAAMQAYIAGSIQTLPKHADVVKWSIEMADQMIDGLNPLTTVADGESDA